MAHDVLGSQFTPAVHNILGIYDDAVAHDPETAAKGMNWYEAVHDTSAAYGRASKKGTKAAAGVVAAVSPNMDWENNNIHAFDEIDNLSGKDWDTISHSSQQGKRTPQAREVLQGYGISVAGDRALMKAHLIWHGGVDPEEVLNRRTAPKTNSFMHNIHDLGKTDVVTVDGRASDEHEDTMRPWDSSRGINSAATKTGKVTRYEVQENSFREAARARGIAPHQMQAVTWEQGKNVERNWKPGRKKGDARKGQSYQGRIAEFRGGGGA
jgi:hypothetical protein